MLQCKNKRIIAASILFIFIASAPLQAEPINEAAAENVVQGWLNSDEAPLGASLGTQIAWTDAYIDANDVCIYYIVYLDPSGFVIVAADDLVEPIVGFVTGYALFDSSSQNTLSAIIDRDLPARVSSAKKFQIKLNSKSSQYSQKEMAFGVRALRAKTKWNNLKRSAAPVESGEPAAAPHVSGVSDLRVAPLLASKWGQDLVSGTYCYNYYTPNHYYSGCVATAMAQFMRYWQWPSAGIGAQTFRAYVSGSAKNLVTRGGDGLGGPYNWNQMELVPDSSTTAAQRQAIGALCYDAGVAVHMWYDYDGSGAYMSDAKTALTTTFRYSNAIYGGNGLSNIGADLANMINPNLDSGNPVILGAWQNPDGAGHAFISDGYGYNSSTLYHHLNLGWDGYEDAWYNLPNIDSSYSFNVVNTCIYNIFTSGTGEIISGRITHISGEPFPGATITAEGPGGPYTSVSNENGIYALIKVQSNAFYTLTVTAPDSSFDSRTVTTGRSSDGQTTSGNRGGIDFVTSSPLPPLPSAPASITYPAASITGIYTVSWPASANAVTYQLMRTSDGGISWMQIYLDSGTSYAEDANPGTYHYSVRALNGGGPSDWTTGAAACVVAAAAPAPSAPASITYPSSSSTGKFTVSWSSSSGATSYQLQRSNNAGTSWSQIYSGASTSYSETVSSGTYIYRVKAANSGGSSVWKTGTVKCVVRTPPAAPSSITYPASSITGKYMVSWPASAGATSYRLERSADGGITWIRRQSSSRTYYNEKALTGNYRYRVTAVNKIGLSQPTAGSFDCLVRIPATVPAKISYPAYSKTGMYKVKWSRSKYVTSYKLERSSDSGLTWTLVYTGADRFYMEITSPGTYLYRVKAVGPGGTSSYQSKPTPALCSVVFPVYLNLVP